MSLAVQQSAIKKRNLHLTLFIIKLLTQNYSFSSLRKRALPLVNLIDNCWALSTIDLRFLDETPWATSAQNFRFCINNISNSWFEKMLW